MYVQTYLALHTYEVGSTFPPFAAEFCLVHLLLSRYPTMFYQHFIECIFHFNSYEKHRVYNRFRQSDRERKLFSLKGAKDAGKRMAIYTFLLSHMADEHRFQLAAKLCQEVSSHSVDMYVCCMDMYVYYMYMYIRVGMNESIVHRVERWLYGPFLG